MAVSSSSKYWLSSTMGYQLCSYHCWWSPILSMGVLHFNKSCPAIFMNNNFLKGCGHSEHVSPKDFLCHNSYCKFHIEMFPVCRRFIKIQLNCIRAPARPLAALLLVKILLSWLLPTCRTIWNELIPLIELLIFRVETLYISPPQILLKKRSPRGSCNYFLCLVKSFIFPVYFPQSLHFFLINKLVGSYSYVTYMWTLSTPSSDGK